MASGVSTVRIQDTVQTKPNANGLAVIISNDHKGGSGTLKELPGTRSDAARMKSTLDTNLNFAVYHEHNVTQRDLRALLTTVATKVYPPSYRRVIVVFTGHGTTGQLYTNDGKTVQIDEILTTFCPDRARNIGNIPKLFFIDACRGEEQVKSVLVARGQKGGRLVETVSVPNESNFLVAFATLTNCKSYETGQGGTWMTMLAEQLKQNASICDILTSVNKELMKAYQAFHQDIPLQQPEFISRLNEPVNLYVEAQLFLQGAIVTASLPPTIEVGRQLERLVPQHKRQLQHSASFPQQATPPAKTTTTQRAVKQISLPPKASPLILTPLKKQSPLKKKNSPAKKPTASPNVTPTKKEAIAQKPRASPHKKALEEYCRTQGKPSPSYEASKTSTGEYKATVYVAKTIGRVAGEPQKRKYEAEEDAARQILQKLRGQ